MKRLSGVLLPYKSHTANLPVQTIEPPEYVRIPMLMHRGSPCEPVVEPGDHVAVGQCIGIPTDDNAAPIHASVSGTVTVIKEMTLSNGNKVPVVEIQSDGEQLLSDRCVPLEIKSKTDLIEAVRQSGCVGMSGAGIPTWQKLNAKQKIDLLIVNGAECEPYISADCRQMLEAPDDVLDGIKLVMQHLNIKETRIGIMKNKPAAIQSMTEACAEHPGITVCPLPTIYPQGAEKVLIFHTSGRIVRENQTSADNGVLVLNVSTLACIGQYSKTGIPLIDRIVTVDGTAIKKPCNLRVPIGTPVKVLLDYAKCDYRNLDMLICGGLMMGETIHSPAYPISKLHGGVLAMRPQHMPKASACIRCGKCMKACPMHLMPMLLAQAAEKQDIEALNSYHASVCLSCGCCSYVCPAHRPLASVIASVKPLLTGKGEAK